MNGHSYTGSERWLYDYLATVLDSGEDLSSYLERGRLLPSFFRRFPIPDKEGISPAACDFLAASILESR